jgi:sortase A
VRGALAAVLLLLGAWQAAEAVRIPAKAWLAQRLLERAWSATAAGGTPVQPWPWADTWPVARLRVPSAEVDLIVLDGASGPTLAFGPALAAGGARFGQRGASVVAGHRDTHFRFLRALRAGDAIEVEDAHGVTERFVVTSAEVADSRASSLRTDAVERALVLVTCWPFDAVAPGGPLRYVVTAFPALPAA